MFVLILPPAGGDELQGIKRGVIELADLVLVNKADGELASAAHRTAADYASAMGLIRPPYREWQVPVRAISALEGVGIREVWDDVARFRAALEHTGAWSRRRTEQARAALWSEIGDILLDHFRAVPAIAEHLAAIEEQVTAGTRTPSAAARQLLTAFLGSGSQITAT
jgi:LAO/AO transport system kinase